MAIIILSHTPNIYAILWSTVANLMIIFGIENY